MNRYKLFQWQAIVMFSVLLLSLTLVSPAFADEAPPPPAPTEGAAPAADSSSETVAEGQESASPTETEASESAPSEESVAEILEQLPADTELIIVDENGETLPLASEAAEEAIVLKDPIWCPAGVLPKPGIGGCSGSFASLSALVAGFVPPAKNGVIWIEEGNDPGTEVEIDGLVWTAAANYSLTLQGGWVGGLTGNAAIVGTTTFDTAISIINWNGAVTINDISFDGANNTFNSGTGSLYVETTKNIVVSNVMSINSTGGGNDGVHLDNSSSTAQSTVIVKNSTFNSNILRGITILSDGAVTLTNVTAHFNTSYGVYIDNNQDSTASIVSVTKGFFNQNANDGLHILSNGAVKLSQISASSNTGGGDGVDLNNTFALTPQAVTVSGFLIATTNQGTGLRIASDGAVTLTTITTDYNGSGTVINNSTAPTPLAVTINGFNSMSENNSDGLNITSYGTVTINNITATNNNGTGVLITTYGAVTTNNIIANTNLAGMFINNTGGSKVYPVNIKGVNSFSENSGAGLEVLSSGAINTYNLMASSNGFGSDTYGVNLINTNNPLKPQNITLFGINQINGNSKDGLLVTSHGIITVNNLTANWNGLGLNSGTGAVFANGSTNIAQPIFLKGTNTFNNNLNGGVNIYSTGAVNITNIVANGNTGITNSGVYIENINTAVFQSPVTISGYGIFNNNTGTGLLITSHGIVTTNNLSAFGNGDSGVQINTIGIIKPQAVTMKGNNIFVGNGNSGFDTGLAVFADGNITVSNLTASQNFYRGADLDNFTNWNVNGFTTFGSVTVTGFGNFYNNGDDGLNIYTKGNATMSYITANQNGDDGVGINAQGKVNLTCVLVTENANGVYMFTSATTLTIKGLSAVGNTAQNESLAFALMIRSRCP